MKNAYYTPGAFISPKRFNPKSMTVVVRRLLACSSILQEEKTQRANKIPDLSDKIP